MLDAVGLLPFRGARNVTLGEAPLVGRARKMQESFPHCRYLSAPRCEIRVRLPDLEMERVKLAPSDSRIGIRSGSHWRLPIHTVPLPDQVHLGEIENLVGTAAQNRFHHEKAESLCLLHGDCGGHGQFLP